MTALKQKRRTLKNRGYALNCRVRRIQSQLQLEADNLMLREHIKFVFSSLSSLECRCLRETLAELHARLSYYEPTLPQPSELVSFATTSPSPTVQSTPYYQLVQTPCSRVP